MGPGIDEQELRRRAIEGVRDEVEAFGSGAPGSRLIRREGLLAAVTPASPQRSLFNSVFLEDPAVLPGEYEALGEAYEAAGVQAWTVWVADEDRAPAEFLAERGIRWQGAYADGEPVCCVGTIEVGDDCCVTGVATPPEHRGRGIASWLLLRALAAARTAGALTASLQATMAGAPIYERLGFRDLGFVEMWELRR